MLLERFQFSHNYVLDQVMLIHCKEQQQKKHQQKSHNLEEKTFSCSRKRNCV